MPRICRSRVRYLFTSNNCIINSNRIVLTFCSRQVFNAHTKRWDRYFLLADKQLKLKKRELLIVSVKSYCYKISENLSISIYYSSILQDIRGQNVIKCNKLYFALISFFLLCRSHLFPRIWDFQDFYLPIACAFTEKNNKRRLVITRDEWTPISMTCHISYKLSL